MSELFLHEEILLLALRDEKGTAEFGSMHGYAMGGGILAELLLSGHISVEPGKKKFVNLVSTQPIGEPVLDDCLERIAEAKRRVRLETWVSRFGSSGKLHHRVAGGLCERGILRADEDTVLLIFKRKVYPEIDPEPERRMIARLRFAIFEDGQDVDPRTVILVSLAKGADLLRIPFGKRELKTREDRIEMLCRGEGMGEATAQAVEAAQVAMMMAAMMPVLMTTTIASS